MTENSLPKTLLEDLDAGKFGLLLLSTKFVVEKEFLTFFKQETIFHRSLAVVVVDKSQIVEICSGKSSINDQSKLLP